MIQELIINFIKNWPLLSIILFSFIITFFLIEIYRRFTDQEKMKELKERQKEIQKKIKQVRNNPEKLMELQKEMMYISTEQLKQSFKPMIITSVPLIIVFILLRNLYNLADVGNIIYWHINLPIVGDGAGWFLSYIIFSLFFNSILRKILEVH